MRRQLFGFAAAACLATASGSAFAQGVNPPQGYGGFGGQYVQAPSLYYPYPGVIESRFGTYFSTPIIPGVPETAIEAATINAANAARQGIDLRAEAAARDAADAAKGERNVVRKDGSTRTYARGYNRPPAPFRRALPRGDLGDINSGFTPSTYSPAARMQTYGQAYGMGPYGTNYYSGYWHGYAPMQYYPAPIFPVP